MSKFFHAFASRLLKAKHIKGLASSKAASEAFRLDKLVFFEEESSSLNCPGNARIQKQQFRKKKKFDKKKNDLCLFAL